MIADYRAKTLGDVAAFLGVHVQTVKQWRQETPPLPGEPGAYDLAAIVRWYVSRLTEQLGTRDKSELEIQKLQAEVDTKRLRLEQLRGTLVERSAVAAEISTLFHRLRARLESLPDEAAMSVPAGHRAEVLADWKRKVQLLELEIASWSEPEEFAKR